MFLLSLHPYNEVTIYPGGNMDDPHAVRGGGKLDPGLKALKAPPGFKV